MVNEIISVLTEMDTWLIVAATMVVSAALSHTLWKLRPQTAHSTRINFGGMMPLCLLVVAALLFSQRSDIYQPETWLRLEYITGFSIMMIAGIVAAWIEVRRFPAKSDTYVADVFE